MRTVALAALILWLVTAVGGFVLLGTWIAKGGVRQRPRQSHLPPGVLFGHFLLAVAGLIVWIVYLVLDIDPLAWVAFGILAAVALLGFSMFARWLPVYRRRAAARASASPGGPGADKVDDEGPPERHFPVAVVGAHGLLGAATLVLVVLTAVGVGG